MPEGDTILWAATRMRPVLVGEIPDRLEMPAPHPRAARGSPDARRWAPRLRGRQIEAIETRGKNLFVLFEGDLVLHSHLMMTGSWTVRPPGRAREGSLARAWIVFERNGARVIQFNGPVLRLLTRARLRSDPRLRRLGPDLLAPGGFDLPRFCARVRAGDQARPLADVLLDQSVVAGIGNGWKVEGCWMAQLDPRRPVGSVSDDDLGALTSALRERMLRSGLQGPHRVLGTQPRIYGTKGQPCPRCGTRVRAGLAGSSARMTFWCPGCQR